MEARTHGSSVLAAVDARSGTPSADPWDAPYFGAPVYFSYQPALPPMPEPVTFPAAVANTAAVAELIAWPFFGAPTYAGFPAFEARESSEDSLPGAARTRRTQRTREEDQKDSDPSVSSAVTSVSTSDPWDAPYFGAPVYLGYFPTRGREVATPALVAARPAPAAPERTAPPSTDTLSSSLLPPRRRSWWSGLFNLRRHA